MERNKKFLLESRILGTVNYKDFISADPNWVVKKNEKGLLCTENSAKTLRISRFLSSLNKSVDEAKIAQEARKAAFIQADKTIKATEEEMLYNKLNALKNVLLNNIDTYIVKYFGDNFSGMSAYEKLIAEKQELKKFSNSGSNPSIENYWLTRVHQTAYAEAIVYKYFADMLKASTDRRSGLVRTMNNLSTSEKEEAKNWLKDHVKSLVFRVPVVTTNADGDDNIVAYNINKEFDNDKADEIRDHINNLTDTFEKLYPNAKEGRDFVYRETAKENDVRKDLWNLGAITTFDTKIDELPTIIKTMLETARCQSTQETKSMAEIADEYSVSSYAFAQAILKLFDNNFNFYLNKKYDTDLIDGSDKLINDYMN